MHICLIQLIRNSFRHVTKKYWGQIAADLKPLYTAASDDVARRASEEFEATWVSLPRRSASSAPGARPAPPARRRPAIPP
ncbi:MAG: transposase [Nocardioides sp.]|nr:transposase [Nocardioides sp.]